ncbi:MAG TPA: serine hydrolase [Ignavibacteriaceae bacterium]|nr:serine hydrolase [Ignavibacteriaceae bacterium]
MYKNIFTAIFFIFSIAVYAQIKSDKPEDNGFSSERLSYIDSVVNTAIANNNIPGAVVLVGKDNSLVYKKAFGKRSLKPVVEEMTEETIFDMASVTKSVATATAVMILVERGKLTLTDEVRKFIPGFTPYIDEKEKEYHARIYHLLTHTSGLPAYTDTHEIVSKYGIPAPAGTIETIAGLKKNSKPGKEFVYSCLGFITLAEIVKRISGVTIDIFTEREIFNPLGMKNSFYFVPKGKIGLCAPTEMRNGEMIRGVVHDPLAWIQGGISGNAGLFSTGDDIAVFAQMMLNKGEYNGKRILGTRTVETMSSIYPPVMNAKRGLGWDVDSDYMWHRGDIFKKNCYGHTGFTGTSLLLVPEHNLFIVVLTNRVHIDSGNGILNLRRSIANIVAASMTK